MADFVNTIDLLGDEATAKAIIERTITEYNDDAINSIGSNAFHSCKALTSVDLPSATAIGSYAFDNCSSLTSVDLPNVTSILQGTFYACIALTSVSLPNVTSIGNSAFHACKALTSVDLPNVTSILQGAFSYCQALNTLVLRNNTLCTMESTYVFNETPFASNGTGGTVYVPSALIEQYQTATNWSTLYAAGTCNFVAIEGSEYE